MNRRTSPIVKITPPVLDRVYSRKRLFRFLDRGRQKPILWVSGPPGCGKTTLVVSYLAGREIPCLWYQVDEGDQNIASFFYHMGLAAKRAAPRKRRPLPLLTPEYLPGLLTFTKRYFEKLYGRLKPGSVMVFDNYQDVPSETQFQEVIREGLSCMPDGISAVLISRSDPPSVFARMRVHRLMEEIGWKELRLTSEETKGIVRLRGRKKPSGEEIRHLQDRSDGWMAGLVLLLERGATEGMKPQLLQTHTPQELFDYFGTEIFARLDGEARTFLLRSAFLPRMTARMAQGMTRHKRAGIVLSRLSQNNYFTEVHQGSEPVYEYHALFRDFLLSHAEKEFSGKEISRLRKTAAAALEECGYAEDAATLHAETSDWEGLSRVILTQAPQLARQGRFQLLEEWLTALPEEIPRGNPWLLYWRGTCRLPFDPLKSRDDLEEAFWKFRELGDAPGAFQAWSGVVATIAIGLQKLKPLDYWYSLLEETVSEFGGFPSPEIEARVLSGLLQGLGWRQPLHIDMDKWADRALEVGRATPDIGGKAELLVNLALFWSQVGEIDTCDALVGSIEKLLRHPDVPPLVRLNAIFAQMVVLIFRADFDRCLQTGDAGLSLAEESGIHFLDMIYFGYGVLASLHRKDGDGAVRFLERMEERAKQSSVVDAGVGFYYYVAACEALSRGNSPEAVVHREKGNPYNSACGNPIVEILHSLQGALLFHASGDRDKAFHHLAEARKMARRRKTLDSLFLYPLTEAFLFLEGGKDAKALSALREGLRYGREKKPYGVFMYCPGFLETLCVRALEEGIEVDYVREIVRRSRLVPGKNQRDVEEWPWPLKVTTLGRFGMIREESPLPPSRKVPKKPFQMLKLMIALGGRDLPEEQITDCLWPEADGDLASNTFKITLYRLRKLTGNEKAISVRAGILTLDDRYLWVDAWAFEQTVEKAEKARREIAGGEGGETYLRLADKAISLYKGPFLEDEDFSPRIVQVRDRLRNRFVRCVANLGRHREDTGEWEQAIDCYQRGLEVEELSEELYRLLILAYLRTGRRAEALAVYRRCRKTLATHLGSAPSSETESVAKALLEGA